MFFKPDTMELEYGAIEKLGMDLSSDFDFSMDNSIGQMDILDEDFLMLNNGLPPSIASDLAKITEPYMGSAFIHDEEDIKSGIRNADCMWPAIHNGSNAAAMTGGSNSAASSYTDTISMPLAAVSNSQNPYDLQQQQTTNQMVYIKDEPMDEVTNTTTTTYPPVSAALRLRLDVKPVQQTTNLNEESIPPGGSLLRKRNTQASESLSKLKVRPCLRPDTPHSMDDEGISIPACNPSAPEFLHNVDLRACLTGSNNISLSPDGFNQICINQICQDLQGNGKGQINVRFPLPQISDVLEVLNNQDQSNSTDIYNKGSVAISPPTTSSDCDSDDGNSSKNCIFGAPGQRLRSHRAHGSASSNMMQHITDHSYTRCNDMVDDGPSLDTPSDSGENRCGILHGQEPAHESLVSCHGRLTIQNIRQDLP
ncbi:myc protein isoform X2 [Drosophila bipectinata]|uniref:myc protein isoform X2 n=1 Tax=Drosophila bipectinata TaxID=42026 RepID=UPI0038B289DC